MKHFLLFFVLLTFSSSLCAQQFSGKVVDATTKEPLAYASVYWKITKEGVLTDEEGRFQLQASSTKKDELEISYIGYEPKVFSLSEVKQDTVFSLQPNDLEIEEVVITPLSAEEIFRRAVRLRNQNHFENNSMQPAFSRSFLYYENELLQVSELAFNQFSTIEDKDSTQIIHTSRSRTVIDSTSYSEINEIVNRKKDTVLVDPSMFTAFGNNFALSISSSEDDDDGDGKFESIYVLNGSTTYAGREAYDISFDLKRKDEQFLTGRFLIDEESFAFLAYEYESKNEESYKKMIPFAARAVLTLMGYHLDFTHISGKFYYRQNGDKFDLDKGISSFGIDVKKGGTWMSTKINQEFHYLPRRASTVGKLPKFNYVSTDYVSDFSDADFFSGVFHLPSSEQIHESIAIIQQRNDNFNGNIASDRHLRWLERQN